MFRTSTFASTPLMMRRASNGHGGERSLQIAISSLGAQSHQLVKIQAIAGVAFCDGQSLRRLRKGRDPLDVRVVGEVNELKYCEVRKVVEGRGGCADCDAASHRQRDERVC